MRCIICKADSSSSTFEEHIIPESLGNTDFTLPPGIVCDSCNNYIAREIEKPFLDTPYIVHQRQLSCIPNKRGRIPMLEGWALPPAIRIVFGRDRSDGSAFVAPANESDEDKWVAFVRGQREGGSVYLPMGTPPDCWITSRFIAKVGLEALAERVKHDAGMLESVVDQPELDELREHIRYGGNRTPWPFSRRSIYAPDKPFGDGDTEYTIAHEYDILVTKDNEYFVVLAIFGEEYALNLGGRCIEGYDKWLNAHGDVSPLYFGKNL